MTPLEKRENSKFKIMKISLGLHYFLLLLYIQTVGLIAQAQKQVDCSPLSRWTALRSQINNTTLPKLRSEMISEEYQLSREISKSFFQKFQKHEYNYQILDHCLRSIELLEFQQTLNSVFRNETMNQLLLSKSPRLQNLITQIGRDDFSKHRIFFKVTGHLNEKSPTELVAGFHRSGHNIFIDISKINPDDWSMIFIHELVHLSDSKLSSASETFANQKWVQEFYNWSQKTSELNDLPPEIQSRLRQWVISGLDRGLLFEYRAWLETFKIYNELISLNEIPRSPFMDYGLSQIDHSQKFSKGLYDFLDKNSSDPELGIFTNPLIQSALKTVREELRKNPPTSN